jgi:N-acetylglucosamine-6-sulfatase
MTAARGGAVWMVLGAAALLAACGGESGSPPTDPAPVPSPGPPPSIVLVVTDDLDVSSMPEMPIALSQVAAAGMTFRNAFVPTALCAPSRVSLLTGEYGHNHGLYTNAAPRGGYQRFRNGGGEQSTVATWLRRAGYRTIFLGKYVNGYPAGDESHVPPGWDDWHADFSAGDEGESGLNYYDYAMNDNGVVTEYGRQPEDYETDVLVAKALEALRNVPDDTPFLMYLAPRAPHRPALRAPRHDGLFAGATAPRTPSFGEVDASDKPYFVRSLPLFTDRSVRQIDQLYRDRLACLQSVDQLVGRLLEELSARGRLAHTYVILTSDNGYVMGPHRFIHGKETPYEEALRVPLYVRGPGIPAGVTSDALVLNIDYVATFVEWAQASAPEMDGRSLVPLLATGSAADWRSDFLLEHWQKQEPGTGGDQAIPDFFGVRTAQHTYVEYATGERELYDLQADPYQLDNGIDDAPRDLVRRLADRTAALQGCRGASCR